MWILSLFVDFSLILIVFAAIEVLRAALAEAKSYEESVKGKDDTEKEETSIKRSQSIDGFKAIFAQTKTAGRKATLIFSIIAGHSVALGFYFPPQSQCVLYKKY